MQEARKAFELVISKYPNQRDAVKAARDKLSSLQRTPAVAEEGNKEFSIRKVCDVGIFGAISPDGRYLSYEDMATGDLAIYEIPTGNKRRLTNKGSWYQSDEFAQFSRWSPDGKQVVYDWVEKDGHVDLRIIGLDGSKPRILYSNKESLWAQTYGWSPDGKQILANLEKKDGQNQIVLVSAADGSVRVLKTMEQGWPDHMNFSPDGRYIVYDFPQKGDSPERDISLLSTEGSREIPLVEHPADDYALGWAPDGKNILFASDRRNSLDVWFIQFSDGKVQGTPELIKSNIGIVNPMGFTQNGFFYYGIADRAYDIYFAELDPKTGKMLAPPKKASTRFEGSLFLPEYSPDGKTIAYISVLAASHSALRLQSLETGKMQEFPLRNLEMVICPRWSPDGRSILVSGLDLKGSRGIYRIDTQTGIFTIMLPTPLTDENWTTTHEWSRDGKAIFLARNANNPPYQTRIMRRDLESGIEKEFYRGSTGMFSLSCSPDGQWLAFMRRGKEGLLGIMPAAGGEPRELYRFKQEDQNFVPLRWAADGKSILFEIMEPGQKKWNWWRIPMEGGEPQKLGLEWDSAISASFHPDGRHIAFSSPGSTGENSGNWVMENFLPQIKAEK
jgi:Tol biopolymer transport system component